MPPCHLAPPRVNSVETAALVPSRGLPSRTPKGNEGSQESQATGNPKAFSRWGLLVPDRVNLCPCTQPWRSRDRGWGDLSAASIVLALPAPALRPKEGEAGAPAAQPHSALTAPPLPAWSWEMLSKTFSSWLPTLGQLLPSSECSLAVPAALATSSCQTAACRVASSPGPERPPVQLKGASASTGSRQILWEQGEGGLWLPLPGGAPSSPTVSRGVG